MKIIRDLKKILNRTIDVMVVIAGILLIFSVLSISMAVGSRYLLGRPWGWVIEMSEYSLLYIAFLVAAWVLRQNKHVRMDLVIDALKPRIQSMLNIITSFICSIVCLVLFLFGAKVTWELFKTHYFTPTLLEVPKAFITVIIPIGFLLLFFQSLNRTSDFLSSWRTSGEKKEGSE
jgi:TRAP-type C4-dicarboxylate transport system permease small subunit